MRKMLMIACLLSFATMCGCNKAPTPEERGEQWRKAAEQGDAKAQYNLGLCLGQCYFFSKGGRLADLGEAAKWWRKAAEQGYAQAQFDLGHCYFYGWGVAQDKAEAVKWYRKAAEQGLEVAELVLKRLEQRGGTAP